MNEGKHANEQAAVVSRPSVLKTCQDHFFDAFDISNRREISGRHGAALARNYLYPSVVVLVVVGSLLLRQFDTLFLWPEQQTSKSVADARFVPKKSGPGPCGRSVCIPPTHLCPTPKRTTITEFYRKIKELRGGKKKKNLPAQGKIDLRHLDRRVMMKERNFFSLLMSPFYYYAL